MIAQTLADPAAGATQPALALDVSDLSITYRVRGEDKVVVSGFDLKLKPGQSYGIVGESGCGKSTVALAIMNALPENGRVAHGSITVAGTDLLSADRRAMQQLYSESIAMVYQAPVRALNPVMSVGRQLAEVFSLIGQGRRQAMESARAMLRKVRIADPDRVLNVYPRQLSGGMAQRVVIAMALAKNPALLVLDEPTTGLDATVEAEVLDLVSDLRAEYNTAMVFI